VRRTADLVEKAGLWVGEQVLVDGGNRFVRFL
jgi:hypothetical protein